MNVNELPNEILCIIFSLVDFNILSVSRVCRRWKNLCSERVHFKFINMDEYHKSVYEDMMDNIFQVENVFWSTSRVFDLKKKFFLKFKKLKSICLHNFGSSKETEAMEILALQKQVINLTLYSVDMTGLEALANCKNLTSLSIHIPLWFYDEQNNELKTVFEQCEKLSTLDLSHVSIFDDTMSALPKALKSLSLVNNSEITDDGLKHIGERCHFLENITVSYNDKITERGVEYIASGCLELVYAEITSCFQIDDHEPFIHLMHKTNIEIKENLKIDRVLELRLEHALLLSEKN